jgi:hypothetical protein
MRAITSGRMLSLYIYSEERAPGSSEDAVVLRVSYNDTVGAPPRLYRLQVLWSVCNSYGYRERTQRLRVHKRFVGLWSVDCDLHCDS